MKKLLLLLCINSLINANDDPIVIGIGESCGVSGALEAFKLKKASYPFEWCISEFEHLYQSIKYDFADFINPDYFTMYFNKRAPVNKYGIVLAHDFPLIENGFNAQGEALYLIHPLWKEKIPEVQAKYQRRVQRFKDACMSGKKVYFVRFLGITEDYAKRLSKLLRSSYPNLDFTLICVRLAPPHLGTWHIDRTKNYYIYPNSEEGDIGGWKRIFADIGLISPHRSFDNAKLQEIYMNSLCGECSYCKDFIARQHREK